MPEDGREILQGRGRGASKLSATVIPAAVAGCVWVAAHLQRLDTQHGQQLAQLLLQVLGQGAGRLAVLSLHLGVKDVQDLGLGLAKVLLHLAHLHGNRPAARSFLLRPGHQSGGQLVSVLLSTINA